MDTKHTGGQNTIFTIGHSNHPIDVFLNLLRENRIDVVVDVRSHPFSKYVPHFDAPLLKESIISNGMKYLFMGDKLGGRPKEEKFYDENGYVIYSLVAETPSFLEGIVRLERGIQKYRVAIMCSEENPAHCHRRLLIGRVLISRGIEVYHIRGDGKIQTDADVESEDMHKYRQQSFLDNQEVRPWKSTRSVLQKKQRNSSSES